MGINELFLSLVPTTDKGHAWHFRARVLVAFMLSLGVVGMVYWWVYFRLGNRPAAFAILAEALLLWGLIAYFRKTGALRRTTNICMIAYCIMMGVINFSSGGTSWTATPWWTVAPVFVTLVVGGNLGKRYFALVLSVIIGAYILENFGIRFPDLISKAPEDKPWLAFLHWFHYVGVVLYLTMMTFMFDIINRTALEDARLSLEKAGEATQLAQDQSTYLAESVEVILEQMGALAQGDLTAHLNVTKEDEIGRLCAGFNQSVKRVQGAITDVLSSVQVTSQASERIAKSAIELARGTQEQTDAMGNISDAVSSMVASITQNADSASNSSEAARGNGRVAREGGNIVAQTVHKIDEIAEVVDVSAKSIRELAESSKAIGQIVSVIQAVASRTNLLALNASIEAAHAGIAGKGFGVIADEVKELANQTAAATEKITEMIGKIQKQTTSVITDMEHGLTQVQEGKVLASQAGGALQEIVSSSENLIVTVEQIALACEEQSQQSTEFMERITHMKSVSDQSVQEINGIASSTVQLEKLNGSVKDQLGVFKLSAGK